MSNSLSHKHLVGGLHISYEIDKSLPNANHSYLVDQKCIFGIYGENHKPVIESCATTGYTYIPNLQLYDGSSYVNLHDGIQNIVKDNKESYNLIKNAYTNLYAYVQNAYSYLRISDKNIIDGYNSAYTRLYTYVTTRDNDIISGYTSAYNLVYNTLTNAYSYLLKTYTYLINTDKAIINLHNASYTNVNNAYTNLYTYITNEIPRVYNKIDGLLGLKDALLFNGSITAASSSTNTETWNAIDEEYNSAGATYKVENTGYVLGRKVFAGTMIIAKMDEADKTNIDDWIFIDSHVSNLSNSNSNLANSDNQYRYISNIKLLPDGTLAYTYSQPLDKLSTEGKQDGSTAKEITSSNSFNLLTGVNIDTTGKLSYSYSSFTIDAVSKAEAADFAKLSDLSEFAKGAYGLTELRHNDNAGSGVLTNLYLVNGYLTYDYTTLGESKTSGSSHDLAKGSINVITGIKQSGNGDISYQYSAISYSHRHKQTGSSGTDKPAIININLSSTGDLTYVYRDLSTTTGSATSTSVTNLVNNEVKVVTGIKQGADGKLTYSYTPIKTVENNNHHSTTINENSGFVSDVYLSTDGKLSYVKQAFSSDKSFGRKYEIDKTTGSINVITGISIDENSGKISYQYSELSYSNSVSTSNLIKINSTTSNGNFPIVFTNNGAAGTNNSLYVDGLAGYVTVNPSTNTITATNFAGNATTATKSTYLRILDLRGESHIPSYYGAKTLTTSFEMHGVPVPGWHSILTLRGWDGNEYKAWQLASNADNTTADKDLYFRTSKNINTDWHDWKKIIDASNWTSYITWTNLPGKPSSFAPTDHTHEDLVKKTDLDKTGTSSQRRVQINNISIKDGVLAYTYYYSVGLQNSTETTAEVFNDYSGHSALAPYSHAEGLQNTILAAAEWSHAEGSGNIVEGKAAHAEGSFNEARGNRSHVGGLYSTANYPYAFAHGFVTYAKAASSGAIGDHLTAYTRGEFAVGTYNLSVSNLYMFTVGGGNSPTNRKNLLAVAKDGNTYSYFYGNLHGTAARSHGVSVTTTGTTSTTGHYLVSVNNHAESVRYGQTLRTNANLLFFPNINTLSTSTTYVGSLGSSDKAWKTTYTEVIYTNFSYGKFVGNLEGGVKITSTSNNQEYPLALIDKTASGITNTTTYNLAGEYDCTLHYNPAKNTLTVTYSYTKVVSYSGGMLSSGRFNTTTYQAFCGPNAFAAVSTVKTTTGDWSIGHTPNIEGENLSFIWSPDTSAHGGTNADIILTNLPKRSGTIALCSDIPTYISTKQVVIQTYSNQIINNVSMDYYNGLIQLTYSYMDIWGSLD